MSERKTPNEIDAERHGVETVVADESAAITLLQRTLAQADAVIFLREYGIISGEGEHYTLWKREAIDRHRARYSVK